ncbi:efflux RND transporter permease subunit [Croceicoccus hydrothermalis]|uniref:efflux RND transporter permease subunit n=1 Tax=Croceicoccus hydrothermalis TaxID=2867964 RepID=UPI001EFB8E57|nr:efflux RND transporter permease subunit [Croceicoccus hydrothermalis]
MSDPAPGDAQHEDRDAGSQGSAEKGTTNTAANFFFLKTTFGILLLLILSVGGLLAYTQLVKESLPDLEIPQATISTQWPGSDPQTIEQQITQPIEDELTSLAGVDTINSASFDSFSLISVEFQADADAQSSIQRLRAAVDQAGSELPAEAEQPSVEQVSVDDRPIMTVALYGEAGDVALSNLAERAQDRLERLSGVNEVELGGAREEIVRILLDPQRLLALGLSPTAVRDAVQSANLDQPFGEIETEQLSAVVRMEGRFRTPEDLARLPVTRIDSLGGSGAPILLGDVATVERALETEESKAFYQEGSGAFIPSVSLSIKKTPGADTIEIVDLVRDELEIMNDGNDWPAGVEYAVTQNEAETIWDALIGVFNNGWQAMLAVFVILLLVLTWREGLIAGLAVPVTFAGVLLVIMLLGYTLNELVIIGMVLALGLLVDVFILMMEGLHDEIYVKRHGFDEAALSTIRQFAVPAFAGQLTTILALAPLMAIGGVSGKFIRVLPITAIACLALAYVVALLICVPLSRYLLESEAKSDEEREKSKADRLSEQASAWLYDFTKNNVLSSKKRARTIVIAAFGAFVLSIVLFMQTPMELYPDTDGKTLGIDVELPAGTTLDQSERVAVAVGAILRDKPYFESVIKLVGRKSPFTSVSAASSLQPSEAQNFVGFSAIFRDESERDEASYVLAEQLRVELSEWLDANVAGATLLVVPETGGPPAGDPVEILLTGGDYGTLQRLSQDVQDLLDRTEGVIDVRDNLGNVNAEVRLIPQREALDFFGLDLADVVAQVRFALANDTIGTFPTEGTDDDLDIRMGTAWPGRDPGADGGPARLDDIALARAFTRDGQSVSMAQVVEPVQDEAPISITHVGGQRSLTVLAKNQDRAVNDIIEGIRPELDAMASEWPDGYEYAIAGEAEESAETFGSAAIALVVALILVFGVLVIMFDSFPQAFILITTMPLALIGSFTFFWLFGLSFSFFAMVGVIALIGVVANNGIVMVDTMNRHLKTGADKIEAAACGAADRLRPILTTSVTTIVGLVPLAIGNAMYRPLCLTIIFGLVSSTVMSLFVVPALYMLLTRKKAGA